jgi:hypothetical protein
MPKWLSSVAFFKLDIDPLSSMIINVIALAELLGLG